MMRRGFSLIELLIVLAIFGVLFLVGTDIVVKTLQDSGQAAAQNDLRQNANQIMAAVSDSVRGAKCLDWGINLNGIVLNTFSDDCTTLVDQYVFNDPSLTTNPGAVFKDGQQISSANALAVNCGASAASCGVGLSGYIGWLRPDGSKPQSNNTSTCLTRVFADGGCRGSLMGFIQASDQNCQNTCDPYGSGLCFELVGTPATTLTYDSSDRCSANSVLTGNKMCSLYNNACLLTNDQNSNVAIFPQAIPLQYAYNPVCVSGAVFGFYDDQLGGNGQIYPFDAATYRYNGLLSGYPNLTLNLTMQNNLNPQQATNSNQCASVTVKDTFTPRTSL